MKQACQTHHHAVEQAEVWNQSPFSRRVAHGTLSKHRLLAAGGHLVKQLLRGLTNS